MNLYAALLLLSAACAGTYAFSLGDALTMEIENREYVMSAETFPNQLDNDLEDGNCWCNTHWCSCYADTGAGVIVKIGIAYDEVHCHCSKCFVFVSVVLQNKTDDSSQKELEWREPVNKLVHLCTTFMGKHFCYSFIVNDKEGCCPKSLKGYVTQLEPNHRPIGTFTLPMEENETDEG